MWAYNDHRVVCTARLRSGKRPSMGSPVSGLGMRVGGFRFMSRKPHYPLASALEQGIPPVRR